MSIGRRFMNYVNSLPGVRDPREPGLLGLRMSEPFYQEAESQLSVYDYVEQAQATKRLVQILARADALMSSTMRKNPSADPKKIALWAIGEAAKQLKKNK